MEKVRIFIYTTYISICSDHKGNLTEAVGQIRDVLDLLREIIYIPRFRRYQVKSRYYLYDTDSLQMRLPRHMLIYLEDCLKSQNISFEHIYEPSIDSRHIEINITSGWTDRPEQIKSIAHLSNNTLPMRACDLQPGKGKAQPLNSLIRIPRGWKRMGDIEIGDTVISADGTETKVTGVYPQGKLIVYRVTFCDGRYIDCSGDHLWRICYPISPLGITQYQTVNTLTLLRLMSNSVNISIPLITSENYNDIDLPIPPYILGKYFGTLKNLINGNFEQTLKSILIECKTTVTLAELIIKLNQLDVYCKYDHDLFIPHEYLEGSENQRRELLKGILNTDHYDKNSSGVIRHYTPSKQFAKDLQYLVHSLGGIANIDSVIFVYNDGFDGPSYEKLVYVVNIQHKTSSTFFKSQNSSGKHQSKHRSILNSVLRISSVEKLNYSEEMQCISVDHPSKLYVTENFIVTHNTYSAIRVIETIKNPTLLICGGLVEQWVREFEIKTDIDPSEIYIIKGAGSIIKLLNSDHTPTIFIASIDTLRAYVAAKELPYSDILSYSEFLEKYNIGIKVVDEFHLNFNTIVNIDLCSNVANNLYLSATPKRSSGAEKEIFKRVFPIDIIDGGEGYDRYVNVSLYRYNLEYPKETMFNTQHGYSHSKYETYIMNNGKVRQRFIDQVIFPLINSHYINKKKPGQKLLVFCRTVAFCELICDYISTKYPDLDVRTYTQTDSECNLEESDVIVSTPQSCGTGKDIANLRTVLQTCSIGSEPLVEQILGRLRKLPNGDTPEFVDIMNSKLGRHWAHYRSRAKIYKERAFRYNEFNLC